MYVGEDKSGIGKPYAAISFFLCFSFHFTSITVNWNFVFSETLNKLKLKLNYLQLYKLSVIVKLKGKSYFSRSSISI